MTENSGTIRAEFDRLVGEIDKGGAPEGIILRKLFDPYKSLHRFILKNPEFIPQGLDVIKKSDDQGHLDLIVNVMNKKPDSVSDGFDALIDNGHERAFQMFKSFLENNPEHVPLGLFRLTEFLKNYELVIVGKDGESHELRPEKGFNTIQLKALSETLSDNPAKYGFHPVEMLEFHVEVARIRNEEAFRERHQIFTDKVLRAIGQDSDFLRDMSDESRGRIENALQTLFHMECVTQGNLREFDTALRKKTGKGLGFGFKELHVFGKHSAEDDGEPRDDVPPSGPDADASNWKLLH